MANRVIDDYGSNSAKSKSEESKEIQSAISQPATPRKKSGVSKAIGRIISYDRDDVGGYVVNDVIVPTIKKTILEVVRMIVMGGSYDDYYDRGRSRYFDDRRRDNHVPYRDFYNRSGSRREPSRSTLDYDPLYYRSWDDADIVLDRMRERLSERRFVTLDDYYRISGVREGIPYTYCDYGWTDLRNAYVESTHGEYTIRLPRVLPLD